jgi:LPS-assembly lipoprotein
MAAMHEMRRAILLGASALLLTACGFELRGSTAASVLPFSTLYIDSQVTGAAANSSIAIELKRRLSRSGTLVVDDPKAAEATVQVLNEIRDRQILSLNSQGRVREYTLNYRVNFQVLDPAKRVLRPPEMVVVYRTLTFNESQVLAKEGEEQSLYRDMQSDMVGQLLRRVGATRSLPPATAQEAPQNPTTPTPGASALNQPNSQAGTSSSNSQPNSQPVRQSGNQAIQR